MPSVCLPRVCGASSRNDISARTARSFSMHICTPPEARAEKTARNYARQPSTTPPLRIAVRPVGRGFTCDFYRRSPRYYRAVMHAHCAAICTTFTRRPSMPMPTDTHLVLLHSPLVGQAFWQTVAERLCLRGQPTHAPRLPSLENSYAPFWLAHAAGIASGLPETGQIILAAHSAAGVLLPAIGRLQRNRRNAAQVQGYLFVDCDLPRDGATRPELWHDQAAASALRERVTTGPTPHAPICNCQSITRAQPEPPKRSTGPGTSCRCSTSHRSATRMKSPMQSKRSTRRSSPSPGEFDEPP